MEKIIQEGTEVLVFKYVSAWGINQDEESYIRGVVVSSKQSDDLSQHGTPIYKQVYEVLGEDGKLYFGAYGQGAIGGSFFRTREDQLEIIKKKIDRNNKSILEILNQNAKYFEQINLLNNLKTKEKVKVISK